MNEFDLIHIQTRFVNDYLLTLAAARRARDHDILKSVSSLTPAKCARSFGFPAVMEHDTTLDPAGTTL